MNRLLLIADACVVMDHGYFGGLNWLCQLGRVEVLDSVLAECRHRKQPNLVEEARAAGLFEIAASEKYVRAAASSPYPELSTVDALLLYYSKGEGRILLTNEEAMRNACSKEGVEVHGTIWLIQRYFELGIAQAKDLCAALDALVQEDRRVPLKLVNELRTLLGCEK